MDLRSTEFISKAREPLLLDHVEDPGPELEPSPRQDEFGPDDLAHSIASFSTMIWPVTIAMVITAFLACTVRDEATETHMKQYLAYQEESEPGSSQVSLAKIALLNSLCIVGFMALVTILVVVLYKYNMMKALLGYLIASSAMLLGLMGGTLIRAAIIEPFALLVDSITFWVIIYNFAIVGTLSIFYQKGLPSALGQGYLLATTVVLAWQITLWPEWSTWMLLGTLAFYDLCAVLTPCGPLNILVQLIQKEGRPMPGLVYEADVCRKSMHDAEIEHNPETLKAGASDMAIEVLDEVKLEKAVRSFYETYHAESVWKASNVAKTHLDSQEELWGRLYSKYDAHPGDGLLFPASYKVHYVQEHSPEDSTIKLGLGDFIFYSVLVARAATFSFAAMQACMLAVLMGLSATLLLLAYSKRTLPALPISILLGIFVFMVMRNISSPYIAAITDRGLSV